MNENEIEKPEGEVLPETTGEVVADLFDDDIEASDKPESNKTRNVVIAVIVLALIAIVAVFFIVRSRSGAAANDKTAADKDEVVVSVKVAKAEKEAIAKENSAIGTVAPSEQSTVSASISAQIRQMRLLKNAVVQKGEILAVLASQDLAAQRAEAQAAVQDARLNLQTLQNVTIPQTSAQSEKDLSDARAGADNARVIYERRKDLFAKGGISQKEVEASQLALTNAENTLRLVRRSSKLNTSAANPNARLIAQNKIVQAESHLKAIETQAGYAEVRAPISGIVTDQFQFEGDFAAQGARLVTISNIGAVIIKANFADSVVADLRAGDMVTVYLTNAPDERMSGKVSLISHSTDPQNRTVEIWANFANGRGLLRAGDAVKFVVSSNATDEAVVVPVSAVTLDASNADQGIVMVVGEDSLAHEKKVKIGIKQHDKVQIVEGLNGGETVVTEGNYALPDGTKVEIAKDEKAKDEER